MIEGDCREDKAVPVVFEAARAELGPTRGGGETGLSFPLLCEGVPSFIRSLSLP